MSNNSPMMHRVKRGRFNRRLPSLPRKGRIRFVFAVLLVFGIIRIGPPLVRRFELPALVSARDTSTDTSGVLTGTTKKKSKKALPVDINALLLSHPEYVTENNLPVFDGRDSLTLYTSIDSTLQASLFRLISRYHPLYGGIVALDPVSGRILALVSYTGDSMPEPEGNICLNASFPAASVYKTITAAAAIELAGFSAACSLQHRGRSHTLYHSQLKRELDWSVDLTFAQAYSRSINAVFGRIGIYELGSAKLLDISHRFGFNRSLPGELSCAVSRVFTPDSTFELAELASGFNQRTTISPLHGALIAAGISQKGLMPVPTFIDSIVRSRDHTVSYIRNSQSWLNPVRAATALELQKMMYSVVRYGTAAKQFRTLRNSRWFDEFTYGGKTGSVDKDGVGRVDWFIGYAVHPQKTDERIAIGAVTVHGAYWTVHSSYLAAEAIRYYLKALQDRKAEQEKSMAAATVTDTSSSRTATP
ncbi:MAG: hypothetical protein JW863_13955 [Chitinispirillaceae bacterium]|nr:hypothetical protein [Chitinispirillaceae bacterium]